MSAVSISKLELSGSTDGLPIAIQTTSTTLHTATATSDGTILDEVWVECYNPGTTNLDLTVELGTTSNPMIIQLPAKSGLKVVLNGLPFDNSKVVSAKAASNDTLFCVGFVNRITNPA